MSEDIINNKNSDLTTIYGKLFYESNLPYYENNGY